MHKQGLTIFIHVLFFACMLRVPNVPRIIRISNYSKNLRSRSLNTVQLYSSKSLQLKGRLSGHCTHLTESSRYFTLTVWVFLAVESAKVFVRDSFFFFFAASVFKRREINLSRTIVWAKVLKVFPNKYNLVNLFYRLLIQLLPIIRLFYCVNITMK